MKVRINRFSILQTGKLQAVLFTMFIILVCGSSFALAGQDNVAIDKVRLNFNSAFNEGNAEAIAQLIDPNGIWMPPGQPSIVGKDSIVAHYSSYFERIKSKFELKPGDIQLCDGWAFISGAFSRADTPKTGGAAREVSGHYLMILKKQPDGTWKIARDIWNDIVKP